MRINARTIAVLSTLLVALAGRSALAGSASLAWNPVSDSDLSGYRVYYGTSPGAYTSSVDVGNVTQTTISTLTDCTTYYFGVKAYDTTANESVSYSNEVNGWPRPTVTSATPSAAEQGRALSITLAGSNFRAGSTVTFSNPGITVNSTTINACGQITVGITIANNAAAGAVNVEVTHADGVFGTGTGIFTVQATVAPTVSSTTPADGATGASIAVHPTVVFSEPMLPSSITASTVRLLDDTSAAVPQAAGSPSLSTDGRTATITPAANLSSGETYRVQAAGGASGVLDLANHGMASTFTQPTGFSTVADTTAPIISAVASSGVGSTTATIAWTTDEPSDSQVSYRKQGDAAYQQTAVNPALVTSHSVPLTGLAPSTTYEYFVRSADSAGNVATSTPIRTFATGSNGFAYIRLEAEGGTLVSPVRSVSGASGAFGGGYIDTPSGTPTGSASSPAGRSTMGVNIPTSGTWYLWVRMWGPDANTDSWFESINGASRQAIFPSSYGQWVWVAGRSYTLSAGLASVELGGREQQARVDRVLLTNDSTFVPTEQAVADQTPPSADTGFTATGATAQVTLSWTNSNSSDFVQTVIRYRTDGTYPTSPADGFAVTTEPGAPGSADSFVHTGLTNGLTYSYSAFAIDSSGNVAAPARASATVSDTTAPGNVQNLQRTDKR
ncbi:MAG TPA: Ig-like domain-containing protein [Candidatus Polarisedimenticolaceae bacterium]|nr:Ig-like domain-containing protein [Candidatus Polarisedimenticolaceae bacterium]